MLLVSLWHLLEPLWGTSNMIMQDLHTNKYKRVNASLLANTLLSLVDKAVGGVKLLIGISFMLIGAYFGLILFTGCLTY